MRYGIGQSDRRHFVHFGIGKWMLAVPTTILMVVGMATLAFAANGFDQYGYNWNANIFNGTYLGWCQESLNLTAQQCTSVLPSYGINSNDRLNMKWNSAWNACNKYGTPASCSGAWLDNESNGEVVGGSGIVWHYKIVWSSVCASGGTPTIGGYCVWGSYEVLMDQGTVNGVHSWYALAAPNGYGFIGY